MLKTFLMFSKKRFAKIFYQLTFLTVPLEKTTYSIDYGSRSLTRRADFKVLIDDKFY